MFKAAALTLLVLFSSNCLGFGFKAHRVIAQIAENHLSAEASMAIAAILSDQSLASVSTWADEMRYSNRSNEKEIVFWSYDYSSNWHFVNIDPDTNYAQSSKNNSGDAYIALLAFIALLEDQTIADSVVKEGLTGYLGDLEKGQNPTKNKELALKFLVHLVADLHQPLHVGYESDRGGNDIDLRWFGRKTNLHSVWDSRLLDSQGLNEDAMENKLEAQIKTLSPIQLLAIEQASPMDWIDEVLLLRDDVYATDRFDNNFEQAYVDEFTPMVEDQLIKAGLRLAATLNQIFK